MKITILEKRVIKTAFHIEGKPNPLTPTECTLLGVTHAALSTMEEGTEALTSFYPESSKCQSPLIDPCFIERESRAASHLGVNYGKRVRVWASKCSFYYICEC